MSIQWGWDKQTVVHLYSEILHNNLKKKKNELPIYEVTQMNTENIMRIKEAKHRRIHIDKIQFM